MLHPYATVEALYSNTAYTSDVFAQGRLTERIERCCKNFKLNISALKISPKQIEAQKRPTNKCIRITETRLRTQCKEILQTGTSCADVQKRVVYGSFKLLLRVHLFSLVLYKRCECGSPVRPSVRRSIRLASEAILAKTESQQRAIALLEL